MITQQSTQHSQLDNFKGKIHKFTKKDKKKGGKANTSKQQAWKKIKNCSKKCPYFGRCEWENVSLEQYDGKCGLKNLPISKQREFEMLMSGDESKLDTLYFQKLTAVVIHSDPEKGTFLLGKAKRDMYGSTVRQHHSGGLEVEVSSDDSFLRDIYERAKKLKPKKVYVNDADARAGKRNVSKKVQD